MTAVAEKDDELTYACEHSKGSQMTATAMDFTYLYPFASVVDGDAKNKRLRLATSGGVERHPYFFTGRICYPRRTADLLLAVSLVSRTRFYSPTELRERLLLAADPVVTSGGERLRFEAFSVCCGVYCRLDLKPEAIDGDWTGRGTTNVDFNAPMRASLTSLLDSEKIGLNVGSDRLEIERAGEKIVERKVKLPVRWLKGFVEVQSYQSRLRPAAEVSSVELRQLLRSIPQQVTWQKGPTYYLVPAGKGLRLSQREAPKSIAIGAPGRLKMLEDLLRHARTVRIYNGDDGVSGWELVTNEASFHLVLSPDASRGFSGEGQILRQLSSQRGLDSLAEVRAALKWQANIDPRELGRSLQVDDSKAVDDALGILGSRGLVGFDLSAAGYFHRELPFDLEMIEELYPRLQKARKLIEENAVRVVRHANHEAEAYVRGTDVEHRVIVKDEDAKCTCSWYAKHQGERGPCSHMLAVELALDAREGGAKPSR